MKVNYENYFLENYVLSIVVTAGLWLGLNVSLFSWVLQRFLQGLL